ncbi:MAG: NAD kinase, partial [bacterium]|nr:NAD kinase [bacterium]
MLLEKLAYAASKSERAQQGVAILQRHYDFVPVEEADVMVVLGGDGFMLDSLHRFMERGLPIYGMNLGSVGFLMNEFKKDALIERINTAKPQRLFPLRMTVTNIHGQTREALAFNEVALIRYTQQ